MHSNGDQAIEGRLVHEARMGSAQAFSELAVRHTGRIFRTSRRILKNDEDAEDNVQNTLVKAYRKLRMFRGTSRFSTWLTRIAINEALQFLRRSKARRDRWGLEDLSGGAKPPVPMVDRRPSPERECAMRELAGKALIPLPVEARELVMMHHGDGWTTREIAGRMGLTNTMVKYRLFAARIVMKREMGLLTRA